MTNVLDHGSNFTLLPRDYYLSDAIFEQEIERVFNRQWHYVGHLSEIPHAGDFLVIDLLDESIIVARDKEGGVNALLNVCRHRGHPLCRTSQGNTRMFVCPYHNWAYGLDGQLRKAPSIDDGDYIDYKDWGLHTVHVEVWRGLIFICLGQPRVPSVTAELDTVAADVARLEPENMRKVEEISYEINANWKVLLENFQECYHCQGSHPELCVAMDLDEDYAITMNERPVVEIYGGGIPPKSGMASISPDGRPLSRKYLGEFGRGAPIPDAFHAGFAIQPMLTRGYFHVDHATIHTLRPLGVNRVQWITRWFVHEDAVEGDDFELHKLTEVWRVTNEQDLGLVQRSYKGVKSRRFVPGPLSAAREPALKSTTAMYLQLMNNPA